MLRPTTAQRRALLARRHLLAPPFRTGTTEKVARALLALHATDPSTVTLSACARLAQPTIQDVERALYEDRTLLRMHCMRRTLFAVPVEDVRLYHFSTTLDVARRERASLLRLLCRSDPQWDAARLAEAEQSALDVLERLGEAGATEISAGSSLLSEMITLSPGKPYEARQRVGGWVLRLLAMDGRIRRGRPLGGWTSGQFRYRSAPELPVMEPAQARAEVVRRRLASFGPDTTDDVKWWTGWTLTAVRRALADAGAVEVELPEGTAWILPEDAERVAGAERVATEPWAALLPGLDPTTMGWKHRDWYLDPGHRAQLFDTSGNAGPTVWWNGEIIGGWACRPDGEVVWRLLADRGTEAAAAVEAEAERLTGLLGEARFVPTFPTPLSVELSRD
ncbi:hypothetical protein N566_19495 [Streptomycetaceae bacterium MP113-05]|nr:hypothetical protein N566_19495 [Streptomycetaceae bacterium MP113-05]